MERKNDKNILLSKILRRKLRRNIVKASFDMDWLSFEAKVNFACNRLKQIPFTKGRLLVSFWEKTDTILHFLQSNNCNNWKLLREYKLGRQTPGRLEIYFENSLDENLVYSIIKKHYGYELAKPDSLSLDLVFELCDSDDKTICHLYDDRGFSYYYVNPK